MKPFLILQLRPETEAADDEYAAFLRFCGLSADQTHRIRLDCDDVPDDLKLDAYSGVIVGGGPGCVSDPPDKKSPIEAHIEDEALRLMQAITARDFPFMGCCYGIGVLAHHLGGEVSKARYGESVGTADCHVTEAGRADPILAGLPDRFNALVGHKEALQALPEGCAHLLSAPSCPYQMIRHGQNVYATQFHPEADADGFETRMRIYAHRGYFQPEEIEELIALCRAADIDHAPRILRNFVTRYARD